MVAAAKPSLSVERANVPCCGEEWTPGGAEVDAAAKPSLSVERANVPCCGGE